MSRVFEGRSFARGLKSILAATFRPMRWTLAVVVVGLLVGAPAVAAGPSGDSACEWVSVTTTSSPPYLTVTVHRECVPDSDASDGW